MNFTNEAIACGVRNAYPDEHNRGMTKIELIAAMALQGLLANPAIATPQVIHGENAALMDELSTQAAYLAQTLLEELSL